MNQDQTAANWGILYNAFTAEVCDFNCGTLCAPDNGGEPACCRNDGCAPILYKDELRYLKSNTDMWRRRRARNEEERKEFAEIEDYICYGGCKGVTHCDRRYRSLTCRFFPFEPYIEKSGQFPGLTWVYRCDYLCPLIGNREVRINQEYIDQSVRVWWSMFALYPEEYSCYYEESEKTRRTLKRRGKRVRIFRSSEAETIRRRQEELLEKLRCDE